MEAAGDRARRAGTPRIGGPLAGKKVGVCLSAGYFGFFAHLGLMRALRAKRIEPVRLTGCSAGALLGALWASGAGADAIERELFSLSVLDLVDPPRVVDLLKGPFALIRGERLERRLRAILPVDTFEDCPLPLGVTGFDLEAGRLRVFDSGPLAPAVRASISMPAMFSPVRIDGHTYWDAGVVEKAPLAPFLETGGVDVILLCYLPRRRRGRHERSLVAGLRRSLDSHVIEAARRDVRACREAGIEVLVHEPRVPACGPFLLGRGKEIARASEEQAIAALEHGSFGSRELD